MNSLAHASVKSTTQPTFSGPDPDTAQDEQRALLALSVLDHRMATRDRHEGPERAVFIRRAIAEARMALDGASIDDILEARQ